MKIHRNKVTINMTNNILTAIHSIASSGNRTLPTLFQGSSNRVNQVGEALEVYVKNAFSNSLDEANINKRLEHYDECFSWTGNANNPPDFMLKDGDAIEVKKISSTRSSIQLNSSYPKQRLSAEDPMITEACRQSETWAEKDLIYAVGHVKDNTIRSLWMVYGDCFVASSDVYTRIANAVRDGIIQSGVQLNTETKELARVNKVDPLGITSLRVRGMWIIANPVTIFQDLIPTASTERTINAIMSENKFYSFPEKDRQMLNMLPSNSYEMHKIKTPLPDNPAKLQNIIYIGITI